MSLAFAPARTSSPVRTVQARTAPSLPPAPVAAPLRSLGTSAPSASTDAAARLQRRPDLRPPRPRRARGHRGPRLRALRRHRRGQGRGRRHHAAPHRRGAARATAELAPSSETYAAVALAPEGAGGRDVDVVRLALQDPAALAKQREDQGARDDTDRHPNGVVVDISRKRVLLDGESAGLTYKEFELLQYLVLREGRTIDRHELIETLWDADDEAPSERTIDVHVRRLRSKLARYEDIVRTVRGVGYRFDRHADVSIR